MRNIDRRKLEDLKKVLPEKLDSAGSKLFDEFIRENELCLRQHVNCDHKACLHSLTTEAERSLRNFNPLNEAMEIEDTFVAVHSDYQGDPPQLTIGNCAASIFRFAL